MKIFQINGGVFGSTGRIMFGISEVCRNNGHDVKCAAPITTTNRYKQPEYGYYCISTFNQRRLSVLLDRVTGFQNGFALLETKKLIREIDKFSPDILQLHNIHGSYINIKMLFNYIKRKNIKTVWTLHDCWAFTGHCTHFDLIDCEQWKTGCHSCPQYKKYPQSIYDNSKLMYSQKRKLFGDVENMIIVTPSCWLKSKVEQSFLNEYEVKVINNGIDLNTFKPTKSDFRTKYHCENKKIILGVSFVWGYSKGLDVFIELSKRLPEEYQIVLVGTDDVIDSDIPSNIISIHRTQNAKELAEIYSTADVFVNPTREDTFPTVNIEALACGTPVITFNTGGSPEIVNTECASIIEKDDIKTLVNEIIKFSNASESLRTICIKRAQEFRSDNKFSEYKKLYEEFCRNKYR